MGALTAAWQIRQQNFAKELFVARPQDTESISVTGAACALKCAHCGGHYLSKMTDLSELLQTEDIKGTSCLISGGCDLSGKVQVMNHLAKLSAIKGNHRYNFHVGLLSEEEIRAVAPLADVISFDFLGDNLTITETLKLNKTVEDYLVCYRFLRQYCQNVAPHICIGLNGGKLRGEREALRLLAAEGVEQLVFIVFIPTRETEYAECQPPSIKEVKELLCEARMLLPQVSLTLGCMRPGGAYRRELDVAAVEAGINGLVQPAPAALKRAAELGLTIRESRECCVL